MSDQTPTDRRDTLEYWREIALRQADTLKEQAAHIRGLIRERDDHVATMRACVAHGEEIVHLAEGIDHLQDLHRRTNHARAILALGLLEVQRRLQGANPPAAGDAAKALERLGARADRAWRRHKRRGEPIDNACRIAHNAYNRAHYHRQAGVGPVTDQTTPPASTGHAQNPRPTGDQAPMVTTWRRDVC